MEDRRRKKSVESGLEVFRDPGHNSLGAVQRLVECHVSLGNEVIPSEPKIGAPTLVD